MELYIIRHGQTDWNVIKRLQGQSNTPLNDTGRNMAKEVSNKLNNIHFEICYSSPLDRVTETAELLLKGTGTPIVTDQRLIEMNFGINEGKFPNERTPGCELLFTQPEAYIAPEGAETISDLKARIKDFFEEIIYPLAGEKPDSNILIAGHGAMDRGIITYLFNNEDKDFWGPQLMKNLYIAHVHLDYKKPSMIHDFKEVPEGYTGL